MSTFAAKTTVSADKTRLEIETTLKRYGATQFAYATGEDGQAMIGFVVQDRQVRFMLRLPDENDPLFTRTPTGLVRAKAETVKAYEQAVRQVWRALLLLVKAKLEAVESGIVEFEREFLAHIVLPGGQDVYDHVQPGIAQAYETGQVRSLLAIGS